MSLLRVCAAFALAAAIADPSRGVAAQRSTASASTGVIAGRVTDATTGRPLSHATVRLSPLHDAIDANGNVVTVVPSDAQARRLGVTAATSTFTSGEGRFGFENVRPGHYVLTVRHPAYLPRLWTAAGSLAASRSVVLASGEERADLELRMAKPGVIAGHVAGQDDSPAVGIEVRVLKKAYLGGRARLVSAGATRTDDRGDYRFSTLAPGDYVVAVPASMTTVPSAVASALGAQSPRAAALAAELAQSGAGTTVTGAQPEQIGAFEATWGGPVGGRVPTPQGATSVAPLMVYGPTYYPGVASPGAASVTHVVVGQAAGPLDFHLRLQPSVTVSGRVQPADGAPRILGLRLLGSGTDVLGSDRGFETAAAISDGEGAFRFYGVPPGQYTLRVLLDANAWAPTPGTPASVANMTVIGPRTVAVPTGSPTEAVYWADLPLDVGPDGLDGLEVPLEPGRRVAGRIRLDPPDASALPDVLRRTTVSLRPADRTLTGSVVNASIDAQGRFAIAAHRPGRYFVTVKLPDVDWYVQGVTAGGEDLYCGAADLTAGDVEDVTVTLTWETTTLSGTVRASGQPANAAPAGTVVLFPADVTAWIDAGMQRLCAHTAPVVNGSFSITNLRAGRYLAALVADDLVDLNDPEVVTALAARATQVTLHPGSNTVTLWAR